MADVKWIKICSDIFDDEKILLIEQMPESESLIVIWFKLLCLAGKQNNSGVFMINERIPYTEEMLASIFRRKVDVVRMAIKVYEQFGMIEIIDGVITIPNWGKHQNFDKIDQKNEYMKNYMQAYRQKQIAKTCKVNGKTNCKVNVSLADIEIEEEIDIYKEKDKKEKINANAPPRPKFIKPSVAEIQAYCNERHNSVSAERFYNFYESNGWKVGKNSMKDWKAAVRTWEQRDKAENPQAAEPNKTNEYIIQNAKDDERRCREAEKLARLRNNEEFVALEKKYRKMTVELSKGVGDNEEYKRLKAEYERWING